MQGAGAAAVTGRPVLADAWLRACARAGIEPEGAAPTLRAVLAGRDHGRRLVVLHDVESVAPGALHLGPPEVAVAVLASAGMTTAVGSALARGADGLLTVADGLDDLAAAAAALAAGAAHTSPSGARLLLEWHRSGAATPAPERAEIVLTARERDVLRCMVDGLTTKATARHLGVANKTVEAHRARLFAKLGVRGRSEAIAVAIGDQRLLAGAS